MSKFHKSTVLLVAVSMSLASVPALCGDSGSHGFSTPKAKGAPASHRPSPRDYRKELAESLPKLEKEIADFAAADRLDQKMTAELETAITKQRHLIQTGSAISVSTGLLLWLYGHGRQSRELAGLGNFLWGSVDKTFGLIGMGGGSVTGLVSTMNIDSLKQQLKEKQKEKDDRAIQTAINELRLQRYRERLADQDLKLNNPKLVLAFENEDAAVEKLLGAKLRIAQDQAHLDGMDAKIAKVKATQVYPGAVVLAAAVGASVMQRRLGKTGLPGTGSSYGAIIKRFSQKAARNALWAVGLTETIGGTLGKAGLESVKTDLKAGIDTNTARLSKLEAQVELWNDVVTEMKVHAARQ